MSEAETRAALETRCINLARGLKLSLPNNVGFALVLYDFGEQGSMAYTGTGDRADTVRMLKELTKHLEGAE